MKIRKKYLKLKRENTANLITLMRSATAPIMIITGIAESRGLFLGALIFNSLMDGIDGKTARFLKIDTDFGRWFDTIVDSITLSIAILMFVYMLRGDFTYYISRNLFWFLFPVCTFSLQLVLGYYYKRGFSSFHLYLAKFAQIPLIFFMFYSLVYQFHSFSIKLASLSFAFSNIEASLIYLFKKNNTDESLNSIFQLF